MNTATCSCPGCTAPITRGFCDDHWTGSGGKYTVRRTLKTVEERFWPKVARRGPNECWPWLATIGDDGYGRFRIGGRSGFTTVAHRVAYELVVGPIPEGLVLDHLCRVRHCCNPLHVEPVTNGENVSRGNIRWQSAKTHCPHGHEYTLENTYWYKDKRRQCRICIKEGGKRRWAERKLLHQS